MPEHTLTRRGLLAAGAAFGVGALLSACGGGDDGGTAPKEGGWSFTDDRGEKVTTDARPTRIVAYTPTAAALYDFGVTEGIVGVFGPTTLKDGRPDPMAGRLPVARMTVLANTYGEFNIEKYAGLRPEVLITNTYDPGNLFFLPEDAKEKILALAPSLAIKVARVPLPTPIQRYAELAASLGADLKSAQVTAAKARFDRASETLRQAAKAAGGLKVLAGSASPDLFYVSNPEVNTDLMYFRQLGVDVIVPDKTDTGGHFESLSWENADKYDADLILLDSRLSALQPKDLTAKPAWSQLPAVKAGQIAPWPTEPIFSWAGSATLVESVAQAVQKSKKVR
ncbi:MAG TPA: ABC transporter substrate-binding protein [Thermomonospora sp.]|nr:ABC transporter substrate-binding protein [Thermomonospora sp.]